MRIQAVEALTNAGVGLGVSWAITYLALPLWGLYPGPIESGAITGLYFVISFLRSWIIREAFHWLSNKSNK